MRGAWARFGVLVVVTALVLVPIAVTVGAVILPGGHAPSLREFVPFVSGEGLTWFGNSLAVSLGTAAVCVLVGAPAGYVLSRGRSRLVSGYALVVFVLQAFPLVLAIVPLFILFARVGLVDSLPGVALVYIGAGVPVAVWLMSSGVDGVPVSLEEAAWIDGCSVASAYLRIVLRNSLPAVLTTALVSFLFAWNDYLVAFVFLRSEQNYSLAIGLETSGHSPVLALLIMLPPVVLFAVFHRHFRFGGVAGAFGGV
ncbi:hypothetical protein AX769_13840 [Frondihabitans sp. PAMC 28766]|uniref:carbohydrate ABC transporter permease n=1 Tax=Frondihabitans sp. PAMC 28766 TaxID=1795630 RepID=UPI00078C263E|nr:carbohydrate ABC transporter permease [Frondihabitans sp. PAMC 28766]AMM21016.1 hypothetical protein AX769_13840 [Frondihabitans sp. PAMC 28766]